MIHQSLGKLIEIFVTHACAVLTHAHARNDTTTTPSEDGEGFLERVSHVIVKGTDNLDFVKANPSTPPQAHPYRLPLDCSHSSTMYHPCCWAGMADAGP